MWKYIAGTLVAGAATYGLMRWCAGRTCNCPDRLDGLVVVITGANSGIGKALAQELAHRGATLVLACRSVAKGIEAKNDILLNLTNKNVKIFVKHLDLASIASILKFSQSLEQEFSEIYALVNNAAIFYHPHQITEDGYEITLQTNYLGPFLLTHKLLPLLNKAAHARIINVVSQAHRLVNSYDLKAITSSQTEFRAHFIAYGVSKLALILFTRYLNTKLSNTNVIVNAVDPGNVETNIFRHFPALSNKILYSLQWPIRLVVIKSPRQGAQTLLHCILTSNRSTGQYYKDCKLALPSHLATDDQLARDYYDLTMQILDNKFITESEC